MLYLETLVTHFQLLYSQYGVTPILETFATLLLAIIIYLTSKKLTTLIQYFQRSVQNSQMSPARKPHVLRFIRVLVKHATWVFLVLTYVLFEIDALGDLIQLRLLDFFIVLALFYEGLNLFLNYFIDRIYRSSGNYIYKAMLDKSDIEIKNFSRNFCIFVAPLFWTDLSFEPIAYSIFSWALFFYGAYLSSKSFLQLHHRELVKFISRQLPNSLTAKTENLFAEKIINISFVSLLLLAYVIDRSLSLHNRLLKFQFYKSISAKLLWIHLEQLQAQEEENEDEEVLSDHNYERWFSTIIRNNRLIEVDAFNKAEEKLETSIKYWLNEQSSENDLMIYGANGIGKTTFIKHWLEKTELEFEHAYKELGDKYIRSHDFYSLLSQILETKISSEEDLTAFDESLSSKKLVIVDNCENLFISTINGFNAYKALLSAMNLPLKNIFWIFMVGSDPYYYLSDVFGRLNQFSHSIKLGNWSAEELRNLIMSRHDASKRKLTFDNLLLSSIGNDEYSSYSATADRCFLLLAEISSGNPSVAMKYWVEAASKLENFTIEIGVPEKPSVGFLKDYNSDLLFIYASIIRHRRLSIEEAAKATRQNLSVAQRAMKLGVDNGFLSVNENKRYAIKTGWFPVIHNFLLAKNYLHVD